MADWALAIELAAGRNLNQNERAVSNHDLTTNGGHGRVLRRLTVAPNPAEPQRRQLLTVVRCCQCRYVDISVAFALHGQARQASRLIVRFRQECDLTSDYSTPYQCLDHSTFVTRHAQTTATPPSSTEDQGNTCRHMYCLGCEWLVDGEFRALHSMEPRDEIEYSPGGYGSSQSRQLGTENVTIGNGTTEDREIRGRECKKRGR